MIFTKEKLEPWRFWNKLAFRFLFSYFTLYILLLIGSSLLNPLIQWIGKDLLGITYEFTSSGRGSGDTTYQYIVVLFVFSVALVATSIWSIIDRKRVSYNDAFYWFKIILRIVLIFFMITYGFAKVFKTQFPYPSLSRMLQPVGDMSPMGLAWTFMGYSLGYNIFTGIAEILGGLLLLSKRTETLGSFLIIGVMGNVFIMNLCYDIPVKLFSFHLILMASILFLTDIKRFANHFILNKTANHIVYYQPFNGHDDRNTKKALRITKLLLAVLLLGGFTFLSVSNRKRFGDNAKKPYLYGIWKVSTFSKNNTVLDKVTDNERWDYLLVEYPGYGTIITQDEVSTYITFEADSSSGKIKLHKQNSGLEDYNFTFNYPNKNFLELNGIYEKDSLHIIFYRKELDSMKLNNRGFNWINEYPFNR